MRRFFLTIGFVSVLILVVGFFPQSNEIPALFGCVQDPRASFLSPCLLQWGLISGGLAVIGIITSLGYFIFLRLRRYKHSE